MDRGLPSLLNTQNLYLAVPDSEPHGNEPVERTASLSHPLHPEGGETLPKAGYKTHPPPKVIITLP